MRYIKRSTIDDCIDKLTATLTDSHRHIDNDYGWHQHLGSPKIGIVASAIALLHYKKNGGVCPNSESVLSFIRNKQNKDGGWPYISNTNERSNIESSCWAISALHDCDSTDSLDAIDRGVTWILSQYNDVNSEDNGWPFVGGSVSRVYLTSLVLRTLKNINRFECIQYESAMNWLINAQNDDGGWGELANKGSSIFFTSHVLSTLIKCGYNHEHNIIKKGVSWLDDKLNNISIENSYLVCYLEFIESGTGTDRIRIPFFHYVLPHVIMAYLDCGKENAIVFRGIELLTRRCSEGFIEHPMLENSRIKPIWALTDSVSAFNQFKNNYPNWKSIHLFTIINKRIIKIKKNNPLQLLVRIPTRITKILIIMVVIFILTLWLYRFTINYIDYIGCYWNKLSGNTTGQFIISFIASILSGIIATIITSIFNYIRKKIL